MLVKIRQNTKAIALLFGQKWPNIGSFQSLIKISEIEFWSKFAQNTKVIALLFGQKWPIFGTFQSPIKISEIEFWSKFAKIPRL